MIKNKHISFSISFLLHDNAFKNNELFSAVEYWKNNGAISFHFRPVFDSKNYPMIKHIWENLTAIKKLIEVYRDFIIIPDWLNAALREWSPISEPKLTVQNKMYDICYSALYRFVISPSLDGDIIKKIKIQTLQGKLELGYTNDAWISMCSYRRYDPTLGCNYPDDFDSWQKKERPKLIESINPSNSDSFCNSIICCSHEPNLQVYRDVQELM